jgi:hypothetical protein
LPDITSPEGFFLGLLALVGVVGVVYALYRAIGSGSAKSRGADKLTHELSRIATALESIALQRQEANKAELPRHAPLEQRTPLEKHAPLEQSKPADIPNPVQPRDEPKQEQPEPEPEPKSPGTIPLSMFGRGR